MTVPRFFMTEIRPGIVNATTTMMAVVMQRLRYVATSLASDANSIRTRKYRHTAIAIGATTVSRPDWMSDGTWKAATPTYWKAEAQMDALADEIVAK